MTRFGRIAILTVAVAAALIIAIAFAAASDNNDADGPESTVERGTSVSSTVAPSTSLETTTTSTTRPFEPRKTGKVIPYETGIYVKGASFDAYAFGDDTADVLTGMSAVLGDPDHDTGWHKDDVCEGSATRRVEWGDFELVFTKGANGLLPDSLTFQQWHMSGTSALVASMVTPAGIGVGSTVADLKHAYPDAKVTRARSSDEAGIYLTRPEGGPFIQGFTKDTSDKSALTSMWAGLACQRILG
jgi:hypothetical protein